MTCISDALRGLPDAGMATQLHSYRTLPHSPQGKMLREHARDVYIERAVFFLSNTHTKTRHTQHA